MMFTIYTWLFLEILDVKNKNKKKKLLKWIKKLA